MYNIGNSKYVTNKSGIYVNNNNHSNRIHYSQVLYVGILQYIHGEECRNNMHGEKKIRLSTLILKTAFYLFKAHLIPFIFLFVFC